MANSAQKVLVSRKVVTRGGSVIVPLAIMPAGDEDRKSVV